MLAFTASQTASFANAPAGTSVPLPALSDVLVSLEVPPVKASLAVGAACAALAAPVFFQAVGGVPYTPSMTPTLRVFRVPAQARGHKRKHAEITGGDEEVGPPTSRRRIEYSAPPQEEPVPRGVKRTRDIDADELERVYKRVQARFKAGPVMPETRRKVELDLCTWVVRREHFLEMDELYQGMTQAREEFIKQQQKLRTPPSPSKQNVVAVTEQAEQETTPQMGPLAQNEEDSEVSQETSSLSSSSGDSDTSRASGDQANNNTPWEKVLGVAAAVKRFFSF
ncbi:hypothetical protein CLU79DRAFT_890082 [Phycomyces nitens]|nr:hypothetical protein CLU79DRAFT_890082 [Phycomyces nitens]